MTVDDEIDELQNRIRALNEQLSAARRRRVPEPVADYTFLTSGSEPVAFSALFGDKDDLIVVHNMGKGCSYCTMWADELNGALRHLQDRASFVVASPDTPEDQASFAADRGWRFRMVSVAGTTFSADLGFEPEPGRFWPGFSAFRRNPDGSIVRTGRDIFGPGDSYCAPWHLFDHLSDGVGSWEPR